MAEKVGYDLASLREEIKRMEANIHLFRAEIMKQEQTIMEYERIIRELERDGQK